MTSRRTISAIDVHAAGEPGRVLLGSHLAVRGATMAEKLAHCREHLEDLRRLVLREPRGYPGLCAPMVLPPVAEDSDFGLVVLEQGGFRPMSGSNLICAVTAVLETQMLPVTEPLTRLRVDTAAGTVAVAAEIVDGRVRSVTFDNVPAFVVALDEPLQIPEYGTVPVDVVFGGQYYVQAKAEHFGLEIDPAHAKALIRAATAMVHAARRDIPVRHPEQPAIDTIGLPMLHDAAGEGVDGRNAVVLPNGTVDLDRPETWTGTLDRSPCGTGTSGRMAAKHARGELGIDEPFVHQSVLGTTFTGRLRGTARVGEHEAVLPSVTGRGWITGFNQLVVDADDPFPEGYTLGDLWGTAD